MTDLTTLLAEIEAAPEGSRELSDEMLLAHGWKRDVSRGAYWYTPDGHYTGITRPDPSRSLDAKLPGENIVMVETGQTPTGELTGKWLALQMPENVIGEAYTEPLARRAACIRGMMEEGMKG